MQSKIEWLRDPISGKEGYSLNPVKGLCPVDCKDNQGKSYCYARRMYKRFHWDEWIEWEPSVFRGLDKLRPGSRVFIGSTMELFGSWVKDVWMRLTLEEVVLHPDLTFIFLTKQPQNLAKWSPFPENSYIGVSATDARSFLEAARGLEQVKATIKFVSLEPLLNQIGGLWLENWLKSGIVQWLIIGQCTPIQANTGPKIEWVRAIVEAANSARVPVFLKNNLWPLFSQTIERIDGWPKENTSYWWGKITNNVELCQELPCSKRKKE